MSSTRAPRARSSAVAQAQRAGKGSQTVWIVVGVVIVVGLAAILAVALAQEETSSNAAQTAEVIITGSLPLLADAGSQAVGMTAPEVTGTALTGGTMSITNDGQARVIGFFTHWCPACRAEVPVVSSWYNGGGAPDDVDFVAVSTAVNPAGVNYPPTRWFEREDWSVPTLLDDSTSSVATAFGLSAYPYWVAVDAEGRVVDQLTGQLSVDEIDQLMDRARQGAN